MCSNTPVPIDACRAAQVGELQEALDAIKWGVDYLLNCHTEPMKFVAMYGSSEVRRYPALAYSRMSSDNTLAARRWPVALARIGIACCVRRWTLGTLGRRRSIWSGRRRSGRQPTSPPRTPPQRSAERWPPPLRPPPWRSGRQVRPSCFVDVQS